MALRCPARFQARRDCVKCVIAQGQLHSRPDDRRIAAAAAGGPFSRTGGLMPGQHVLAPVTGVGPPQAAQTATAPVPPGWSRWRRDPGRHVMGPAPYMPLRTVIN